MYAKLHQKYIMSYEAMNKWIKTFWQEDYENNSLSSLDTGAAFVHIWTLNHSRIHTINSSNGNKR